MKEIIDLSNPESRAEHLKERYEMSESELAANILEAFGNKAIEDARLLREKSPSKGSTFALDIGSPNIDFELEPGVMLHMQFYVGDLGLLDGRDSENLRYLDAIRNVAIYPNDDKHRGNAGAWTNADLAQEGDSVVITARKQ